MILQKTSLKVRFAETDAMGVVYHANYLAWCEAARVEMLESLGMPYEKLTELGFHIPVLEAHLYYKRPAKFGDTVEVRAKICEKPSVRIRIDYEMFCGKNLLLTGHTLHAFVNARGMPIKPPADFMKSLHIHFKP